MNFDLDTLRALWRSRDRLVLLQTHLGDGAALLDVWQAWRADPQRRARLEFIAIDPAPRVAELLHQQHAGTPLAPWADKLARAWPPLTHNLHRLELEPGGPLLLLAPGAVLRWLPQLQARVDAFLLCEMDLSSDPGHGAQRLAAALARLASPGATLRASAPQLTHALGSAGFQTLAHGPDGLDTVYRPRFTPHQPALSPTTATDTHALIVGAGLAGCAMACALAEQGWRSTVIDGCELPAQQASGNPAGLFHGIVHAHDGTHARFNRAAALQAKHAVQRAIDERGALGSTQGLLRLENKLPDVAAMQSLLDAQAMPPGYVQALDATEASALCGLRLLHPAWFYPGGGWVQPAALARSFLQRAGTLTRFRGALSVQGLRRVGDSWQLLDAAGQVIDEAATLVLANAADALRLLQAGHWPLQSVRGQISLYDNHAALAGHKLALPRLPVVGDGYLLPPIEGLAVFGATSQIGDSESQVRESDHALNLQRLQALCAPPLPALSALQGRVGWRFVADDRLPLVGAVPDEAAMAGRRVERLREVPRREGLYVLSALASRGIGWAGLCAQVLAAQISGATVPLESSLVRALDPARFALRRARRAPD